MKLNRNKKYIHRKGKEKQNNAKERKNKTNDTFNAIKGDNPANFMNKGGNRRPHPTTGKEITASLSRGNAHKRRPLHRL